MEGQIRTPDLAFLIVCHPFVTGTRHPSAALSGRRQHGKWLWIAGVRNDRCGPFDAELPRRPTTPRLPHKLCYCETVKNITVSVPDDVYRNARVAAAQRDSSVSALVVAYLERLSGRMDEFARLEALQHEVQAEIGQFRAADRLGRDEVHDRAVR